MIDKDLAALYGMETKVLNQAVKRNIERFPEDFRFQMTKEECLKSQIVTLNERQGQHLKYMPYAFTEQGVAMLSGVLRSFTAIAINVQIMRAFVSMRHFLTNNASVFQRLETIEHHQIEIQLQQQATDKRDSNVSAIIYTQQISRQLRLDIDRHNAQYRPIEVKHFCLSHDRFLCIDESVYHIGASIKDLGKKWFGFSKMEVLSPSELVERINRS